MPYYVYIHEGMMQMKYKNINKSQCHCTTIRRATNAMTDYYNGALQGLGLTASQYSLLKNLYRLETASTSDLAEYVNLDRSTLVRNLKPLQQRGLIVDLAKPNTRNHKFALTDEGLTLLKKAEPLWQQAQAEIRAYLGEENAAFFMEMLYKLQELSLEK